MGQSCWLMREGQRGGVLNESQLSMQSLTDNWPLATDNWFSGAE